MKKFIEKFILLSLLINIVIFFSGCERTVKETEEAVNNINVVLINKSILPGGIAYKLKLVNDSKHQIKQNSVYLSFPLKTENGYISNRCKVEATNNKLDISPKEEIILDVFMQIGNYKNNDLLITDKPEVEISGYLIELKPEYHFQKIEPLE
ncbi:hypothetical protein [Wukongibacter sp. M2B1]|uniref:hypothetical protein n=1 Tax=Wukongibacter sp. M2B1 TaxID=3088895 RepID=UPI003D7BEE3E